MTKKKFMSRREIVDVTAHFSERRVDLAPCLETLRQLDDMGYKNPIVHGGYLRDIFLGVQYRDLDVMTTSLVVPDNSPQLPTRPRRNLHVNGMDIDIMHRPNIETPEQAAKYVSVALCSPAMGLDGKVVAHRDFERAAKEHIYAPDALLSAYDLRRMLMYFERLRQKIPDLNLKMPPVADQVVAKLKDKSLLHLMGFNLSH